MQKREITEALSELSEEEKQELLPVEEKTPRFFRLKNIKPLCFDFEDAIKSGINRLDKEIIGFSRGQLTILSGSSSSGKSTWLSQLILETAKQKHKAALFSGELTKERAKEWLMIPAAGPMNVEPTKYEKFFRVKQSARGRIEDWLNDRVFLYNNAYSMKVDQVIGSMELCIEQTRVDMLVIDNLMCLDLSAIGADKYERQTVLVNSLADLAKQKNVHIFFVCHPRKTTGFLRKDDISGSGDLTNAADNVIIVHRVNTDFRNKTKDMFGWKESSPIYCFDNVLEVCKNRELGVQDLMVGMYFEQSSRRFLNERGEVKWYGWESDEDKEIEGFEEIRGEGLPF